jgi:hypothetical protein
VLIPQVSPDPKSAASYSLISQPTGRVDAVDIVTGKAGYALDVAVTGALPTVTRTQLITSAACFHRLVKSLCRDRDPVESCVIAHHAGHGLRGGPVVTHHRALIVGGRATTRRCPDDRSAYAAVRDRRPDRHRTATPPRRGD